MGLRLTQAGRGSGETGDLFTGPEPCRTPTAGKTYCRNIRNFLKQANVEVYRAKSQIFSNINNPCMSVDIKADVLDGRVLLWTLCVSLVPSFFTRTSKALLTLRTGPQQCMCFLPGLCMRGCVESGVTSTHLVMSQRTAVEGLFHYCSRGGGGKDGRWDKMAQMRNVMTLYRRNPEVFLASSVCCSL